TRPPPRTPLPAEPETPRRSLRPAGPRAARLADTREAPRSPAGSGVPGIPGFLRLPGSTQDDRIGHRSMLMPLHIGILGYAVSDCCSDSPAGVSAPRLPLGDRAVWNLEVVDMRKSMI